VVRIFPEAMPWEASEPDWEARREVLTPSIWRTEEEIPASS